MQIFCITEYQSHTIFTLKFVLSCSLIDIVLFHEHVYVVKATTMSMKSISIRKIEIFSRYVKKRKKHVLAINLNVSCNSFQ